MTRQFNSSRNDSATNLNRQQSQGTRSPATEIDLFALAGLVVRSRKWIAIATGVVMLATCLVVLAVPNKYTSRAVILPSGGTNKMAQLKNLADLSGLTSREDNSSELFPVILESRSIRQAVLDCDYTITDGSESKTVTLAEYFDEANPDRLHLALAAVTCATLDRKTGVISIAVETRYPQLSQEVLSRYLTELDTFNMHKRRSQAADNARYLNKQLEAVELELAAAEDRLEQFRLVNRDWAASTSPGIFKRSGQLERDVELKAKTFLFLRQEYEIAKLDAQKDVPIVRVLDHPSLPVRKSSPRRGLTVILSGLAALMLSLVSVFTWEGLKKRGTGPDCRSYNELRSDLRDGFPRVARLVARRSGEEAIPPGNAPNRLRENNVTAD